MQTTLFMEVVGKLQRAVELAASSPAKIQDRSRKHRLFLTDNKTGLRFLVDSGADVSIVPPRDCDRIDDSFKLFAANGTAIPTYGIRTLTLDLGLRRQFQWPFVIAKVNKGILGADFLNEFNLCVDIRNKQLTDGVTKLRSKGEVMSISDKEVISTVNKHMQFADLFSSYPEITSPNLVPSKISHNIEHHINTQGSPVYSRSRPLAPDRLQQAKQEFQFMLEHGIIRPSQSEWASPLHLVNKKDGSLRPCGDYRRLNERTIPDRYPIPRIEDFHHILDGTKIFSKFDLFKAYFQIPIAEEDKHKTAIITPFGLYEFNVMSFGLRNAPSTFQRFINGVLNGLNFVFPYLDDILIASKSVEEHRHHLQLVLERLSKYGLRINMTKSVIGVDELEFLGYLITPSGSRPLPEKVQAIKEYKLPETVSDLRTFLGLINFYRRYLPNAAETQAVLHDYLKGARKNDKRKINWTDEAKKQFEKCKDDLINATLLTFPDPDRSTALFTDASDQAVGAALQQYADAGWKPMAFYSKKLSSAQRNYSAYDKELLAIYLAVKQFRHLLEGRVFTIFTDHKPITYAFHQKNEKASPRQLRQLQYISQFTTDIRHVSGRDNVVADTLSRLNEISVIDYDDIAKHQENDEELKQLQQENTSLKFKQCQLSSGKVLWCDVSTNTIRPFIPKSFRTKIFKQIHNMAHPGVKATVKNIVAKFIWPGIRNDVRKWAQSCISCQQNKVTRHTKSPIGDFKQPDDRFKVVHVDIIGPLSPSDGNMYCLTCIDRLSSWMEIIPMPNITAESVASSFYNNWITRFGVPEIIVTDQGKQFESELFRSLAMLCGAKVQHTTSYHPQANGKIERLHRTLKAAIRAHKNPRWTESLPTVLLGLRAAIREDSGYSLAEMVYGTTIRLPGEFFEHSTDLQFNSDTFVTQLRDHMKQLKPFKTRTVASKPVFVHKDLYASSHVFLRTDKVKKSLEPPYEGPFLVIKKQAKYFTINIKGKSVNVSIDRLKPAYLLVDEETHQSAPRTSIQTPVASPVPEKHQDNQRQDSKPKDSKCVKTSRSGRVVKFPSRYVDRIQFMH